MKPSKVKATRAARDADPNRRSSARRPTRARSPPPNERHLPAANAIPDVDVSVATVDATSVLHNAQRAADALAPHHARLATLHGFDWARAWGVEVSTTELDDVVRREDSYGRAGT